MLSGTIREIQAVGPTSFELVIVGIRDDEQAPAALRERAAALMDTIDRYKELNNTFSIYQIRGGPETRDFRFEPYYRLLATGRTVDPANYDLVYTAPLVSSTIGAEKAWFFLNPYAIPARVVCPFFKIRPNGLPIEDGSPLLAIEHIFPALAISLALAAASFWICSKLLGSGGKSNG